jgi:hypothetical protein
VGPAFPADAPRAVALLRARRERPCRRAAEERDGLAAIHSITSSAIASRFGGMAKPNALAVGMLMTNSNLDARRIGGSAWLLPRSRAL